MEGGKEGPPALMHPRGTNYLVEVERRAWTERERLGRQQDLPILQEEMLVVAADLERIRKGTEVESPLAVEELTLSRGLVRDAEKRVLQMSGSRKEASGAGSESRRSDHGISG